MYLIDVVHVEQTEAAEAAEWRTGRVPVEA
jgi:hypothetical protein